MGVIHASPVVKNRLSLFVLALLLVFSVVPPVAGPARAQTSCAAGLSGRILSDTTWDGDVYLTGNVTVRNQATLTIAPGTNVIFCGDYDLIIDDISEVGGRLLAEGTAADPIVFRANDPQTKWGRLLFNGAAVAIQPSMVRYALFENGGALADPTATFPASATIEVLASSGTVGPGPTLDHVTISGSDSYGIYVRVADDDPTPLTMSNLTISGSARAPLSLYVSAAGGLGAGNRLTGNADDVIEIRAGTSLGGRVFHDQTWLLHDVPYTLPAGFGLLDLGGNDPILTISPGVELRIGENGGMRISRGGIVAEGTPDAPIIFDRMDATSANWGQILVDDRFSASESSFKYVQLRHGGNADGTIELLNGALNLNHVTISDNPNGAAVRVSDGFLQITDSTLTNNNAGVVFAVGSRGFLRRNNLSNNAAGAVINDDSRGTCVDAIGNYWGSADGPADSSDAADDCGQAATNNGSGALVSDNVLYQPFLTSADSTSLQDQSAIQPAEPWVVADGVQTTNLLVTLRDAQGNPLVGKTVELATTRGSLTQPALPTDVNGRTTATISSTVVGDAVISARNLTDNSPLAAIASVYFWQGYGDTGGLINPSGAPYANPQLQVIGRPFQIGFPMQFRIPMRNSTSEPISVTVTYNMTNLNIGATFTQVDQVSKTLQPGEVWNAPGEWVPDRTGHRCIRAQVDFSTSAAANLQQSGGFTLSKNTDTKPSSGPGPCDEPDATKLIPTSGGVLGVVKHTGNATNQANLVNDCIVGGLGPSANFLVGTLAQARDYQTVVSLPSYTPPLLLADAEVTQAQADAANTLAQTGADLAALSIARSITRERLQWAGQADDQAAFDRQFAAYQQFQRSYLEKLSTLAAQIDTLLAVTEGAGVPDSIYFPTDYAAYLESLQTSGYDAETVAFLEGAGYSESLIASMLQEEITALEEAQFFTSSFYDILRRIRDDARAEGIALAAQLQNRALLNQNGGPISYGATIDSFSFEVGNPRATTQTIDLRVRPVNLPLNWSYDLDQVEVRLDPGETTTITLTLDPNDAAVLEGSAVQVAVEGFIGDENIGGILFTRQAPGQAGNTVYLPMVTR